MDSKGKLFESLSGDVVGLCSSEVAIKAGSHLMIPKDHVLKNSASSERLY